MRGWRLIYTAFLLLGLVIIPVIALFNEKVRHWLRARKVMPPAPPPDRRVLWLHCASVGEFEQGRPVLEYLLQHLPYRPFVVITFFSSSGWQQYRQSYPVGDWIGPLPTDLPWVVRRWVKQLSPAAVFFVKYDLWPNLIHELHVHKHPMYLLSAHMEYLKGLRWWWKKQLLPYLTHIFVQTENDARRLRETGITQVTVAGDSRLVRVRQLAENWLPISGIREWVGNGFCIVAGSIWEEDVRFLARAYEQLRGRHIRWILVPHEVTQKHIEAIHKLWPVRCIHYSDSEWSADKDTLILDTTGLLAYLYFYADAVWIGGGFGRGIHNILEPAVHKKPIFFGPNYEGFCEAHELIALKVAESCKYPMSFSNAIKSLLKDRRRLQIIAEKLEKYITSKPNTPEIIWQELREALWVLPTSDQAVEKSV